jgi:hypothetical protein
MNGTCPNIEIIHKIAKKDKIAFKKHTVLRMHQRQISSAEVANILCMCELVEEYPNDFPLPSSLVMGYTEKRRPIHAVVAFNEEEDIIWVITVYEPTLEEWEKGFKVRRVKNEMPVV